MEDKIYKTGRIYKLFSHINEIYYIGSTHNTLRHRLYGHKASSRVSKKVADWIDDIGADNLQIEELHKYEDLTAKQLKIHEDNVIKEHLGKEYCLNCNRVYRTAKEWREDNKERIAEQKKQYYVNNKELLAEKKKQYRKANKEQIAEYHKQYREANKEQIAEKQKQYRDTHKEKRVDYDKQRYENNREQIAEKKKQKITCPICNCEVNKSHFARHEKSMKHKLNLQEVKSI